MSVLQVPDISNESIEISKINSNADSSTKMGAATWDDKKKYKLIDLLPQSSKATVDRKDFRKNVLTLIRFITSEIIRVVGLLEEKKYNRFDSHVGDSLCQVRAFMVHSIVEDGLLCNKEYLKQVSSRAKKSNQIADILIGKLSKNEEVAVRGSDLHDYLEMSDLNITLSQDLYIIIISSILEEFKIVEKSIRKYHAEINYKKMGLKIGLSKKSLRKLIHALQLKMAFISCQYVEYISSSIDVKEILSCLKKIDDDGRYVFPCHIATSILIRYALTKPQGIVFKIESTRMVDEVVFDHVCFYLRSNAFGFEIIDFSDSYLGYPCILIDGITEYEGGKVEPKEFFINRILSHGFEKVISCYMAKHDQYPGKKLENINNNFEKILSPKDISNSFIELYKEKYLSERELAIRMGCCYENSSLFLIRHIFCSTL